MHNLYDIAAIIYKVIKISYLHDTSVRWAIEIYIFIIHLFSLSTPHHSLVL